MHDYTRRFDLSIQPPWGKGQCISDIGVIAKPLTHPSARVNAVYVVKCDGVLEYWMWRLAVM